MTRTYTRSFHKLDNYFAYVGGLVGIILTFAFFMNFFTERAYDISVASQLFVAEKEQEISSGGFNFLYLVPLGIYKALDVLGCCLPKW